MISCLKNDRAKVITSIGATNEYLGKTVRRLENKRAEVITPIDAKEFFKKYLESERDVMREWDARLYKTSQCIHVNNTRSALDKLVRKIVKNDGVTVPEEQIAEAVVKLNVVRLSSPGYGPEVYAGSFEPEYPRSEFYNRSAIYRSVFFNSSDPWTPEMEAKVGKEPKCLLMLPNRVGGSKIRNAASVAVDTLIEATNGCETRRLSSDGDWVKVRPGEGVRATVKRMVSALRTVAPDAGQLAGAIETAIREVLPKTEPYVQKISNAA